MEKDYELVIYGFVMFLKADIIEYQLKEACLALLQVGSSCSSSGRRNL